MPGYPYQGMRPGYQPSKAYAAPQPTSTAEVSIYDGYFDPPTVLVTPGGTVRWTNRGSHKHTVTDLAGTRDSGDIAPGGSYTLTITRPLTHYYYCRHHRLTMSGTIVVREASSQPQGSYPGGHSHPPGAYPGGYERLPPPGKK
jgi:plastocyanin